MTLHGIFKECKVNFRGKPKERIRLKKSKLWI